MNCCRDLCCSFIEVIIETLSMIGFTYMAISGESYFDSVKHGFLVNFKHCWEFI